MKAIRQYVRGAVLSTAIIAAMAGSAIVSADELDEVSESAAISVAADGELTPPQSVATSGDPARAAMLNAGTQYWLLRQTAMQSGEIEVAGIQTIDEPQSVSTLGSPHMAALLNAGTQYWVLRQASS